MKRQVVIVGAGPGGSTAAFYLAKMGIDVLLLDKETFPREKICGDAYVASLFPNFFDEMGISDELIEHAAAPLLEINYMIRQRNLHYSKWTPEKVQQVISFLVESVMILSVVRLRDREQNLWNASMRQNLSWNAAL